MPLTVCCTMQATTSTILIKVGRTVQAQSDNCCSGSPCSGLYRITERSPAVHGTIYTLHMDAKGELYQPNLITVALEGTPSSGLYRAAERSPAKHETNYIHNAHERKGRTVQAQSDNCCSGGYSLFWPVQNCRTEPSDTRN